MAPGPVDPGTGGERPSRADLRRRLAKLALSLRTHHLSGLDRGVVQLDEEDTFRFGGRELRRKRLLLRARGCSVGTCTMCPLPNEALEAVPDEPSWTDLVEQFDGAFAGGSPADHDVVNVYTNGNFFVDREIPRLAREHVYRRAAGSDRTILMVESLPAFVDRRALGEAARWLGPGRLIVCLGLESADDDVRELCVNSPCTRASFERALETLRGFGFVPRVVLMLKPPFLAEHEAIDDAVASARYLESLGLTDPTFCPTRVSPRTVVHRLFASDRYRPPWLWSVAELLGCLHGWCHARIAVPVLERTARAVILEASSTRHGYARSTIRIRPGRGKRSRLAETPGLSSGAS